MAKKNKPNYPNQKAYAAGTTLAPASAPSGLLGRMFATVKQAAPVLKMDAPHWDEDQVKDLWGKLPTPEQLQFQVFTDQFTQLGTQMKEAHDETPNREAVRHNQHILGAAPLNLPVLLLSASYPPAK